MAIAKDVTTRPPRHNMFDALLEIRNKTEGAETGVSADRATLTHEFPFVSAAVAPIDLGPGRFHGRVYIDLISIDISSGDEIYDFVVLGKNAAETKTVPLGGLSLGPNAAIVGSEDPVAGDQFEILFNNDVRGEVFPKITLGLLSFGTTPSIDYSAYIARLENM